MSSGEARGCRFSSAAGSQNVCTVNSLNQHNLIALSETRPGSGHSDSPCHVAKPAPLPGPGRRALGKARAGTAQGILCVGGWGGTLGDRLDELSHISREWRREEGVKPRSPWPAQWASIEKRDL